jgi:type II secretory pathway component GspD/PulD (secretin)
MLPLCAQTSGSAPSGSQPETAAQVFKKARKLEKKGQVVDAYLLYAQASAMDPSNPRYRAYAQAIQSQAVMEAKPDKTAAAAPPVSADAAADAAPADATPADATVAQAADLPKDEVAEESAVGQITDADIDEARKPQPPRELKAASGKQSFDLRENAKSLFERVTKAYKLDVVFDGDFQPGPPVRFHVEDMDYRNALHALEAATNTFIVPISEKVILVAKDTTQKRQEIEPTVCVTVPLPTTVALQEAQELTRNVQQMFDIQKMLLDSARRLVLIRDRISRVYPAQMLFEQLITYSGQVRIEVEFMGVDKSRSLDYGLQLQNVFNFTPLTNPNTKLSALYRFLGGTTFIGVGITNAQIFASTNKSWASTLMRTEIVSLDGKPATLHIGDKYPVITAGYYGSGAGGNTGGNQFTPPPTFQFEDLGVVVKITPFINGENEITLDVEAEYKVLTGTVTNGIPVIANRKFQSKVRLKDGEWAIMAGLVSANRSRNISGIAGVSSLPIFGPLLRENHNQDSNDEVLLVIKPEIVGLPPADLGVKPLWVGTETKPLSQL